MGADQAAEWPAAPCAYLPAEDERATFGVHSDVAEHYGVSPDRYPPHATTLDYVVAAASC